AGPAKARHGTAEGPVEDAHRVSRLVVASRRIGVSGVPGLPLESERSERGQLPLRHLPQAEKDLVELRVAEPVPSPASNAVEALLQPTPLFGEQTLDADGALAFDQDLVALRAEVETCEAVGGVVTAERSQVERKHHGGVGG